MPFPIFPSAVILNPTDYRETWKTLVNTSEGGVEQRLQKWTRPIREFSVRATLMDRSLEGDVLMNFAHAQQGAAIPFLFVARNKRTWNDVFIGQGDGTRRTWMLPFSGWAFLTIYVSGVEKFRGPDYDILTSAGPGGSDLLVFRMPPAAASILEGDAMDARYVAWVRLADHYADSYSRQDRFNAAFTLIEVKETVDPFADGISMLMPLVGTNQANLLRLDKGTGAATFTRATTATRLNPDTNLLETVAAGVLREDGRGYYNALTQSGNIAAAPWICSNALVYDDGALGVDEKPAQVLSATGASGQVSQALSGLLSPGGLTYTFSVYLRRKTGSGDVRVSSDNLSHATVITGAALSSSAWTRCSHTYTIASGGVAAPVVCLNVSGDEVYACCPQYEVAAAPTRYVRSGNSPGYFPLGSLIEEQRTNLFTYSDDITNAVNTIIGAAGTGNQATSPDGAMTADKLAEDGTTGVHGFSRYFPAWTDNTDYVVSIFVKKGAGRDWVQMNIQNKAGVTATVKVDLVAGIIDTPPAGAFVTLFPFGWVRISYKVNASSGGSGGFYSLVMGSAQGVFSYAGGGAGFYCYVWGAQLELGAAVSSYIPTVAATATRNTDTLLVPTPGNVSGTKGSAFAIINRGHSDGVSTYFVNLNSAGYAVALYFYGGVNKITLYDGVARSGPPFNPADTLTHKIASAWGGSSSLMTFDGSAAVVAGFDGDMNVGVNMAIGVAPSPGYDLLGHIKYIALWNRQLAPATLAAITAAA